MAAITAASRLKRPRIHEMSPLIRTPPTVGSTKRFRRIPATDTSPKNTQHDRQRGKLNGKGGQKALRQFFLCPSDLQKIRRNRTQPHNRPEGKKETAAVQISGRIHKKQDGGQRQSPSEDRNSAPVSSPPRKEGTYTPPAWRKRSLR